MNIYRGICIIHARYEGIMNISKPSISDKMNTNVILNSKNSSSVRTEGEASIDSGGNNRCMQVEPNNIDEVTDNIKFVKISIVNTEGNKQLDEDKKQNSHIPNIINISESFIHDFNNYFPDKFRISRGIGYIKNINEEYYVITCNDIMIKHAIYTGYCINSQNKTIKLDLNVYLRIPEMNLVIMKAANNIHQMPELIICDNVLTTYDVSLKNSIITGEYLPMETKTNNERIIEYKTIDINNTINIIFDILSSKYIYQIPLLNIPVNEFDFVKKLIKKHKIDLKTELSIMNERRYFISKTISESILGLSGSIVTSENNNIGIISIFTDTNRGFSLKALPLFFVDAIVKNAIIYNIKSISGIQMDTKPCTIDFQKEKMIAHSVAQPSCRYSNGKKYFTFNEGDLILEIDGNKFNHDTLLWCNFMNMFVPLGTYILAKSVFNPSSTIYIKIAKMTQTNVKIHIYNLIPIPYNDMYVTRIFSKVYEWKGLIFMEMSEQLFEFYRKLGISIVNNVLETDLYSINNERNVILYNYNKNISNNLSKEFFCSIPYRGTTGYYFYNVIFVDKKKITSLKDLKKTLQTIKQSPTIIQKNNLNKGKISKPKITFKLSNTIGNIISLKVNV
jgi:hypothetical protein